MISGEINLIEGFIALLQTQQLVFKVFAQTVSAHVHQMIFVAHLLQGLAFVEALKINGNQIVQGNEVPFGCGLDSSLATLYLLQFQFNLFLTHCQGRQLDLKPFVLIQLEFRLDIHHGHIRKTAIIGETMFYNFWMHHWLDLFLFHRIEIGVLHQLFANFRLDLLFEVFLQHYARHLAPSEALQGHLPVCLGIGLVQGRLDHLLRKGDGEFAGEIGKLFNGDVHGKYSFQGCLQAAWAVQVCGMIALSGLVVTGLCTAHLCALSQSWCERGDSNPQGCAPPDPKSGAFANFATLA